MNFKGLEVRVEEWGEWVTTLIWDGREYPVSVFDYFKEAELMFSARNRKNWRHCLVNKINPSV